MALRAVVLAAGRGVRMGGRTPKALLPLGDHEPLLGYLMSGLRAAGIENLLVVTGWRHAEVQTFVADRWPGEPTFVRNARFASWGNFHSVRVALDQSPGAAVLVVNSDVVTVPQVLADVAHTPAEMVLAVQRRADLDAEDMRVELDGERVVAIGKGLALERSHGEFCGVSKIGPRVARAYTEIASELEGYHLLPATRDAAKQWHESRHRMNLKAFLGEHSKEF